MRKNEVLAKPLNRDLKIQLKRLNTHIPLTIKNVVKFVVDQESDDVLCWYGLEVVQDNQLQLSHCVHSIGDFGLISSLANENRFRRLDEVRDLAAQCQDYLLTRKKMKVEQVKLMEDLQCFKEVFEIQSDQRRYGAEMNQLTNRFLKWVNQEFASHSCSSSSRQQLIHLFLDAKDQVNSFHVQVPIFKNKSELEQVFQDECFSYLPFSKLEKVRVSLSCPCETPTLTQLLWINPTA